MEQNVTDEQGQIDSTPLDNNTNGPKIISHSPVMNEVENTGYIAHSHKDDSAIFKNNPYLIGVQSKFRRKYYHKTLFILMALIIVIMLVAIIIMACYFKLFNDICETKECLRVSANLLSTMDLSADPCDDFYQFTCGNWAEDHPRPESSNSFDWFSEKQTKTLRMVRDFLETDIDDREPNAIKEVKTMYAACMDTDTMNSLGYQPIFKYLEIFHLPAIPSKLNITKNKPFDWVQSIATIKKQFGLDVIVGFDIFPDARNNSINRIAIGAPESVSVLPFKDKIETQVFKLKRYILARLEDDSDQNDTVVKTYELFITKAIISLVQELTPSVDVVSLQPKIEQVTKTTMKISKLIYQLIEAVENATNKNHENPLGDFIYLDVYQLQNVTNSLTSGNIRIWEKYLQIIFDDVPEAMLNFQYDLILTTKEDLNYLANIVTYVVNATVDDIEMFVWWSIVEELILHTTIDMRRLHDEFSRSISDRESTMPRSLICAATVNHLMGMAVSYAISEPDFLTKIKPKVEIMIHYIRESFNNMVKVINWMDNETKCSTLEKSDSMKSLIGFPEWLLENSTLDEYYDGINLDETTHLDNMMTVLKWDMVNQLESLKDVNEELDGWAITPTNVNAFHTFQTNTITIPLAILQYPFYHLGLEAMNYGSIGTILGHELTHGFDDSGRMFDKEGNLRQWWSNKTITEYIKKANCFVKQYSNYYLPEVSKYIDGDLTLGENIADNGGLREAYNAYQLYKKKFGKEKLLPGFESYTHDQLLFIAFGNLWCETLTTTSTEWALEDTHCPGRIRLLGVLSNSPEFAETFKCKIGSKMVPDERCQIW